MSKYENFSAWSETPVDLQAPLEGVTKAEVAIIGGGFTGLMSAITLSDRGVDVALLEQEFCGFGASGRNAGHLTPTIGRDIAYCLKMFGQERGIQLAHFAEEAVAFTEQVFETHSIDCDYSPTGNIIAGIHDKQRKALVNAAEAVSRAGIQMRFMDEDEMRQRSLPQAFKFGIQEQTGGLLHPGKYVMALRQISISKGVRVYEKTSVTEIDASGTSIRLSTSGGSLQADKVLIATNAFTAPSLGRMYNTVAPLRVTLFNTRPLTDEEVANVGWVGRQGIYTAHQALENYRLTPDNRISGGSKWVQYGFGSKLIDGNQPEVFNKFKELLKIRFPELPDLEIETFWGGWIGLTLDMLPVVGTDKRIPNLFHSVGYNGHGIAQATKMGHVMAHEILGEPQKEVSLLRRRRIPMPPEPLRWIGIKAAEMAMSGIDKRVDQALTQ